jgi:hypothetical protein
MSRLHTHLLALGLAVFGCQSGDEPVDPVWGKQACASCSMLVSEPPHAGQLVTNDGARLYFDDLGCMAAYPAERSVTPRKMWARNADGKWVDATTAKYRSGQRTPMDYGFAVANDGDLDFAQVEAAARKRKEEARR